MTEIVFAYGHKNVQATHKSTLGITKDPQLSKKGDCIVAVSATKALADLSCEFKENLRKKNKKMTMLIEVGEVVEVVKAFGGSHLILTDSTEMVVRKSGYVCSRTLAIQSDKAALDLSRKLVEKIRNPRQKVKITLNIEV